MLPDGEYYEDEETTEFEEEEIPSKSYKLDDSTKSISGYVDDLEAIKQAIYMRLNTELYQYEIYDEYGTALQDLIGEDLIYAESELKDRIEESLLDDDRIKEVIDFDIEIDGRKLIANFSVITTQNDEITIERGVEIVV